MWQDIYKVVACYKGRKYSVNCREDDKPSLIKIPYVKGKRSVPMFGYLYAFDSELSAKNFFNEHNPCVRGWHFELWKARGFVVETGICRIWWPTEDSLEYEWERFLQGIYIDDQTTAPEGTVYCTAIILKEKLAEKHWR